MQPRMKPVGRAGRTTKGVDRTITRRRQTGGLQYQTMPDANERLHKLEVIEPIGARVLIRKDEDRKQTKSGLHLPDKIEIPTITGRIVSVSAEVEQDSKYPVRQYDRVLFNPKNGVPVDFEGDNRLFVVPVADIVAVFRQPEGGNGSKKQR